MPHNRPRMMLKIMIYSFSQKIHSSRQIAKALRENINFMWIVGGNKPDFITINRFRLNMKDVIEDILCEVIQLLAAKKVYKSANLLFGWYKNRSQCR